MDCAKTGLLIAHMRKENKLTQKDIAFALNISNKTISKWECGLGFPDASLWPDLSVILGVDMQQLIEGEINKNKPDSGNINKIRFYVCPSCQNILVSTGSASVFCCGRKMTELTSKNDNNCPAITTELSDGDYYITIDHEMNRNHYILFAAYVKNDRYLLTRLYPEQTPALRIPYLPGGTLYLYCMEHGLYSYTFK